MCACFFPSFFVRTTIKSLPVISCIFFLRTHTACCKYEATLPYLPLYKCMEFGMAFGGGDGIRYPSPCREGRSWIIRRVVSKKKRVPSRVLKYFDLIFSIVNRSNRLPGMSAMLLSLLSDSISFIFEFDLTRTSSNILYHGTYVLYFSILIRNRTNRWLRAWYCRCYAHSNVCSSGPRVFSIPCETRKEAVTFTLTPIPLNSAEARSQHRCAPGKIGGLAEAHTGRKIPSDIMCWYPSRYPCRMHAYIPVGNPLG